MRILLAVATYFGYIFIIVMYSAKLVKYLHLPMHLRSEVYPVIPGDPTSKERSYYEDLDWWTRPRRHHLLQRGWFLFSDYFLLREYFRRDRSYWLFLYPWHIGFILIITFHIFCFFGALVSLLGIPVTYGSPSIFGKVIFGLTLATGVVSFLSGLFGSIGILIKRLTDKELEKLRYSAELFHLYPLAGRLPERFVFVVSRSCIFRIHELLEGSDYLQADRRRACNGFPYLTFCLSSHLSSFHPVSALYNQTFWLLIHTVG